MKLVVIREPSREYGTYGKLYINGLFECHTLEDVDRRLEVGGKKIPGETAIPRGTYDVTIDMSTRFKKLMLRVKGVPQFEGIRIHAGNKSADTEGCILLGNGRGTPTLPLLNSKDAVTKVQAAVAAALAGKQPVTLEIK